MSGFFLHGSLTVSRMQCAGGVSSWNSFKRH